MEGTESAVHPSPLCPPLQQHMDSPPQRLSLEADIASAKKAKPKGPPKPRRELPPGTDPSDISAVREAQVASVLATAAAKGASPHTCDGCGLVRRVCICGEISALPVRHTVSVVIHPCELGRSSSTHKLLTRGLQRSRTYVWNTPQWADLQAIWADIATRCAASGQAPAILFPSQSAIHVADYYASLPPSQRRAGLHAVAIDGTWSNARCIAKEVDRLQPVHVSVPTPGDVSGGVGSGVGSGIGAPSNSCGGTGAGSGAATVTVSPVLVFVSPRQPFTLFHPLRKQPSPGRVSTVEAVALVLDECRGVDVALNASQNISWSDPTAAPTGPVTAATSAAVTRPDDPDEQDGSATAPTSGGAGAVATQSMPSAAISPPSFARFGYDAPRYHIGGPSDLYALRDNEAGSNGCSNNAVVSDGSSSVAAASPFPSPPPPPPIRDFWAGRLRYYLMVLVDAMMQQCGELGPPPRLTRLIDAAEREGRAELNNNNNGNAVQSESARASMTSAGDAAEAPLSPPPPPPSAPPASSSSNLVINYRGVGYRTWRIGLPAASSSIISSAPSAAAAVAAALAPSVADVSDGISSLNLMEGGVAGVSASAGAAAAAAASDLSGSSSASLTSASEWGHGMTPARYRRLVSDAQPRGWWKRAADVIFAQWADEQLERTGVAVPPDATPPGLRKRIIDSLANTLPAGEPSSYPGSFCGLPAHLVIHIAEFAYGRWQWPADEEAEVETAGATDLSAGFDASVAAAAIAIAPSPSSSASSSSSFWVLPCGYEHRLASAKVGVWARFNRKLEAAAAAAAAEGSAAKRVVGWVHGALEGEDEEEDDRGDVNGSEGEGGSGGRSRKQGGGKAAGCQRRGSGRDSGARKGATSVPPSDGTPSNNAASSSALVAAADASSPPPCASSSGGHLSSSTSSSLTPQLTSSPLPSPSPSPSSTSESAPAPASTSSASRHAYPSRNGLQLPRLGPHNAYPLSLACRELLLLFSGKLGPTCGWRHRGWGSG